MLVRHMGLHTSRRSLQQAHHELGKQGVAREVKTRRFSHVSRKEGITRLTPDQLSLVRRFGFFTTLSEMIHTALRIEHSRDEAQRTARRSVIGSPIMANALASEFLDLIQEREDTLRWLLNCRPRKMNRCSRSKTLWKG